MKRFLICLRPTPCAPKRNSQKFTMHNAPITIHHSSCTMRQSPFIMHHAPRRQPSYRGAQGSCTGRRAAKPPPRRYSARAGRRWSCASRGTSPSACACSAATNPCLCPAPSSTTLNTTSTHATKTQKETAPTSTTKTQHILQQHNNFSNNNTHCSSSCFGPAVGCVSLAAQGRGSGGRGSVLAGPSAWPATTPRRPRPLPG